MIVRIIYRENREKLKKEVVMTKAIIEINGLKFYIHHDGYPSEILPTLIDILRSSSSDREVIGSLAEMYDKIENIPYPIDYHYHIVYDKECPKIFVENTTIILRRNGEVYVGKTFDKLNDDIIECIQGLINEYCG